MTLRRAANAKNETSAVCLQLFVQMSENICICGEYQETFFYFCVVTRKENTEIRGNVCCLPSAVNAVFKLSNMMILQLYNSHNFKFQSNNFIIQIKFKIYHVPALRLKRNRILKVS